MRLKAIVVTPILLLAVSGPALAGSNSPVSITPGATAQFLHVGNQIKVCDTLDDRRAVYAQYRIGADLRKRNTRTWNGGFRTCGSERVLVREGTRIAVRSARDELLGPDGFGAWQSGVA